MFNLLVNNSTLLPLTTENCTYVDEHVPHAYSWTIDCMENCTCYDGVVTCQPLCPERSDDTNCLHPVTRISDDGCCEITECQTAGNNHNVVVVLSWFFGVVLCVLVSVIPSFDIATTSTKRPGFNKPSNIDPFHTRILYTRLS